MKRRKGLRGIPIHRWPYGENCAYWLVLSLNSAYHDLPKYCFGKAVNHNIYMQNTL